MTICGPVKFLYPVCIPEGGNQLQVTEGLGGFGDPFQTFMITFPPGLYLTHKRSTVDPTGCFTSLLPTLEALLDSATLSGADYGVATGQVGDGSIYPFTGVRIQSNVFFRFDFDSPNTTLDPGVIGLPEDSTGFVSTQDFNSPISPKGVWFLDEKPTSLRTDEENDQCTSRSTSKSRRTNRWKVDRTRVLEFTKVFGSHVFPRQNIPEWASFDDIPDDDEYNNLLTAWREALSRDYPILALYSQGDTDTDFDNVDGYEVFRLEEKQKERFRNLIRRNSRTRGEYYDIAIQAEILETTFRFK